MSRRSRRDFIGAKRRFLSLLPCRRPRLWKLSWVAGVSPRYERAAIPAAVAPVVE